MSSSRPACAVLLSIASVGLASVAIAAAESADGADVILNQDGTFRIAYKFGMMRIDAAALRTEGPTLLSKSWMRRLEKETRRHLKDRAIDWKTADWRDHACTHFVRTQLGDDTRAAEMIPTVDPPANWTQPDFDDAAWLHQRLGRLPAQRNRKEAYDFSSLLVRTAYLRTYFHVPDPRTAGELALSLTYRGGARVLVNGVEVARGDLPAGELATDVPGRGYPREAYLARAEEWAYDGAGVVGDIRGEYEHGTPGERRNQRFKGYRLAASGHPLTREGWNRLRGLRDRKLAGIRIPAKLLKKGRNVLAIEVRGAHFHPQILRGAGGSTATNWARHGGTENHTWDHCRLLSIRLTGGGGRIPSCVRRPTGVQVWAEDVHRRLFDRDFVPPGAPVGTVRIVAAING